ncbi:hypothetical protein A0J61_09527 [Choanephora cucurbitarum]|uniref:Uncharacterized protein n=1 Tax=Choanephora cucurbitarum TaxID=101091 RepID=A0A1C7N023_9FUNG|nr:hypothetical protein A0J61_09527 [Choanephora cucurbitarum]
MDRKSRTSRSATLNGTNEEVNLWNQICNSLTKLESIQKDTTHVVTNINHIHTSLDSNQGIPATIGSKLVEYYKGCIELSSNEVKTINDIIEKLSILVALRDASEYNNDRLIYFAKQPRQKDSGHSLSLAVMKLKKNKSFDVKPIPDVKEASHFIELDSGQNIFTFYLGTEYSYQVEAHHFWKLGWIAHTKKVKTTV